MQTSNRSINIYKIIGLVVVFLTIVMLWLDWAARLINSEDVVGEATGDSACNVAGVTLYGYLGTYDEPSDSASAEEGDVSTSSNTIQHVIEQSGEDPAVKAIVLEIDSWGGQAVAGEEIAAALRQAQKPTIALIRSAGTSAAYWAATGADYIIASANSDVGGIGVTMSYLDNVEKNKQEGLNYNSLVSGKFKDYGNFDKPLTAEEKDLFLRDIQLIHNNFILAVAENRKLDIEKVQSLADGSSLMGQMAIENGLIDKIGGIYEVKEYLRGRIGEDVNICW